MTKRECCAAVFQENFQETLKMEEVSDWFSFYRELTDIYAKVLAINAVVQKVKLLDTDTFIAAHELVEEAEGALQDPRVKKKLPRGGVS